MYREAPIKGGNFDYIEFTRILKHGKKDDQSTAFSDHRHRQQRDDETLRAFQCYISIFTARLIIN